ncbi:MAG: glycoside hydrolase family 5 protein [Armatimonadetes bacterium]|nr:glycoside hydrolase family 5 protein [Armatimonadota bacterium]
MHPVLWSILMALPGVAQDWQEIRTPPTRRDIAQTYELGDLLDPLDDPAAWQGLTHGQSATATVEAGEGREAGQGGLRVAYEFAGPDRLEYIDLGGNLPLEEGTQALGLWMKGGADPLPARVRIVDVSGETHQFDFGALIPGEWTLGIAPLVAGGHWGGDDNGVLDPPFRIASILFDKLGGGFKAQGELTIAELCTLHSVEGVLQPHGIRTFIPRDRTLLVYEPGQVVELAVQADAPGLSARLFDPFGRVVQELTAPLRNGAPTPLSITPDAPGAYDLQLRIAGQEDSPTAPWADFRFAVLPSLEPTEEDRQFSVCTHFGQRWPLSVMPMIARAGIRVYRDEISWGACEPEKGTLAIPDWCREYIEEGARHGLEPLIIADYANRHYDEGGFPLSPEARAGFARYAALLARELQPHLNLIEVWNEWCGGCGMGKPGPAEGYAPLFREAATAIRAENPDATIIGIGGEWDWKAFPQMMADGAGAGMDAYSIHPYHYPNLAGPWLRTHLQTATEAAGDAAGRPVPLWITEIGWPTHMGASGSGFLHQARCLVRMMVAALTTGAQGVVWYDFKDDGLNLNYNENNFGIVHHQDFLLAPKPGYVAYAHLIASLRGKTLAEQEVTPEGLWRTKYADDGDSVTILFTAEQGQTIPYDLPAGTRVEDMFGRAIAAEGSIEVTWDPVFVIEE